MRNLLAVAFVFTCMGIAQAGTQTKVVFVGKEPDHPFGTHMYMHTGNMLSKCLALTNGVETFVSQGWPKDAGVLDGASTIVIYASPAAEMLLDAPHRDQVDALMKKGVGLVTIHWASSVRKENFERIGPKWLSYLGGTWVSNAGLHTGKSPLKQLQSDHPICLGWNEYELHDEYYLNPTITDKATPLLQVTVKGRPVVVGWAYERPDGGRSDPPSGSATWSASGAFRPPFLPESSMKFEPARTKRVWSRPMPAAASRTVTGSGSSTVP